MFPLVNGMKARKVRTWPSSFESNIDGFNRQEIFIPGSQPGYFFQQQGPHVQNCQMQVEHLLLREPQRLHYHRSTTEFQEGTINSIKKKKPAGKVKQLRQKIQKNRTLTEQNNILKAENFADGDQAMPSDEDEDSEDNVIGTGFFAYLSDDYESEVEIGATIISDESDEDPGSDIEIGASVQAIGRERLDSAGSIELGISFEKMVGDEIMAPVEAAPKTNANSRENRKYTDIDDQKSRIEKFHHIFRRFSKKQYMRCSFRINALIEKTRGQKLSIHNKKAVVKITRKLWHKRDAAIPDAKLEHLVVRKLAQEGLLSKILSPSSLPSSRRIKGRC